MVFTTAKENKTEDRVQNEAGRFADYGSSGPEEPLGPSLSAPGTQLTALGHQASCERSLQRVPLRIPRCKVGMVPGSARVGSPGALRSAY